MRAIRWQQKYFQASAWLQYWLEAVNEHSLHAPFVFDLYRQVIRPAALPLAPIEALRRQLCTSREQITIRELGAGSSINTSKTRTLADIARHSLTPARFSGLLYRLVQYTGAKNILELGTSLGLNTLYLAAAAPEGNIHTLEGCPQTAALAARHFQQLQATQIHLHVGSIDERLPTLLQQQLNRLDLAYLDANHTEAATLRYFEWLLPHLHQDAVVVVDDIHWSAGMQKAWQQLSQHPAVSLSLDLYEAGLLFFRPGMQKQHYVIEF